jgi:DNA-binding MarR family transcriptional regulator
MRTIKPNTILPTPSRPAEETFRELIRIMGLVERVMQPYFARFGISGSQWGVLRNLHRAEEQGQPGLRLTDLSDRLLIRPPSVTGVVDRLERAGLVVRDGSPTDLRAKCVHLTDKGRRLVDQIQSVHGAQIEGVMRGLSHNEQVQLHRLLSGLSQHLQGLLSNPTAETG